MPSARPGREQRAAIAHQIDEPLRSPYGWPQYMVEALLQELASQQGAMNAPTIRCVARRAGRGAANKCSNGVSHQ